MRLQLPEQEEVPTVHIILMNHTCKLSVLKSQDSEQISYQHFTIFYISFCRTQAQANLHVPWLHPSAYKLINMETIILSFPCQTHPKPLDTACTHLPKLLLFGAY